MNSLLDIPPVAATVVVPPPPVSPETRLLELQQTVSASRLNLWSTCRLKLFFRYVMRAEKPPTASMHAGKVVHALLQHWNLARWRRQPFRMEGLKRLFASQWQELQAGLKMHWDGEEAAEQASALRALEEYFLQTPIQADEKPEAVEVQVEADLSRHGLPRLIGIIDLVRAGGRIVDFKLVGKTPDAEQVVHTNEVQLTCYSVMYRDATGRSEGGLELHHLVRTKTPKLIVTSLPPMTEAKQTRLFKQIESYQEGLARADFVPSPGFHCAGCEFFHECRNWS
jgi:putative RecB family exonuclease